MAALLLAPGCASTERTHNGPPGSGIAEYRRIDTDAEKELDHALASLGSVAAQGKHCSPKLLKAFSADVERLEVKSVDIRAHAQAMQARGDAYFDNWQERLEHVKDPQLRALAEQQHPVLHEHFLRVKELSQRARQAFEPFLTGLRHLRNSLERDPDVLGAEPTRQAMDATREHGLEAKRCLENIQRELESMAAILTPQHGDSKHPTTGGK